MDLQALETYFENLCRSNKLVKHGTNHRAWIPFGTVEAPEKNSNIKSPYVQHALFYGAGRNFTQWIYTSELHFLVNVPTNKGNFELQMLQARQLAQRIMLQFDAKIIEDHNDSVTCNLFQDLLEAEMEPIDFANQSDTGWLYRIKMVVDRAAVSQNDWEEIV
jgi:hypothetical protein